MKIAILGADGYYGYPLSAELEKSHKVLKLDNFSRRDNTYPSLIPYGNRDIIYCEGRNFNQLKLHLEHFMPDILIHLAEIRSAPYSMIDSNTRRETINNNVEITTNVLECAKLLNFKIIHIGSMGMYGYENDTFINEGDRIRNPASVYHLTKELDSSLFSAYSKFYDIDVVDLHQGTIWGIGGRFEYDAVFGTVVNRFVVQKELGIPLTIYGSGDRQRSFIHINDSIKCVKLVIDTEITGYMQYNQFSEILSINDIAKIVDYKIDNIPNPRKEKDANTLQSTNKKLRDLGFKPTFMNKLELEKISQTIKPFLNNIDKNLIYPKDVWK